MKRQDLTDRVDLGPDQIGCEQLPCLCTHRPHQGADR